MWHHGFRIGDPETSLAVLALSGQRARPACPGAPWGVPGGCPGTCSLTECLMGLKGTGFRACVRTRRHSRLLQTLRPGRADC